MTHVETEGIITDPLNQGRQALARGDWEGARACFQTALANEEVPEALEGLSWAAWWLNDQDTLFDARSRAYSLYRARGDRLGAARMAAWLGSDHVDFRGEAAIANGWQQRARRLLADAELSAEHGWVAILAGDTALSTTGDIITAKQAAREGAEIGRHLGVADLEVLGLAIEGIVLVSEGQVAEGMARLDEATTAALAGEIQELFSIPWSVCYLIRACEMIRDYDRATQWCQRMKEFAARFQIRFITGVCRAQYGGVLIWRGSWDEAEVEIQGATDDLAATRPPFSAEGLARLGDLRRRQGRIEEAIDLFSRVEWHPLAMLGLADIALQQGNVGEAAERLERLLRTVAPENKTGITATLELLVRVHVTAGDHAQAEETLASLRSIAESVGTQPLRAATFFASGIVAMAQGDHDEARRCFEDAVFLYEQSGGYYDMARARIELASVYYAMGRHDAAEKAAHAALQTFRRVGAAREVERASGLLRLLKASQRVPPGQTDALAGLTRREIDVLRLVAQGLNDREIAARLVLSEHTVHRHISNILTKLSLPSRAAAVAHVARHGLL